MNIPAKQKQRVSSSQKHTSELKIALLAGVMARDVLSVFWCVIRSKIKEFGFLEFRFESDYLHLIVSCCALYITFVLVSFVINSLVIQHKIPIQFNYVQLFRTRHDTMRCESLRKIFKPFLKPYPHRKIKSDRILWNGVW